MPPNKILNRPFTHKETSETITKLRNESGNVSDTNGELLLKRRRCQEFSIK